MLLQELLDEETQIKRTIRKVIKEYYETEEHSLYEQAILLTKKLSRLEKDTRAEIKKINEKKNNN